MEHSESGFDAHVDIFFGFSNKLQFLHDFAIGVRNVRGKIISAENALFKKISGLSRLPGFHQVRVHIGPVLGASVSGQKNFCLIPGQLLHDSKGFLKSSGVHRSELGSDIFSDF